MSLEKATISWSAKQLKSMVINQKVNFDHIVQRSYVWERSRKSALIESMIIGYPIPPIFARRDTDESNRGNNVYVIMDGKQRLSTIKQYLNDEFALSALAPITYCDDEADCERTEDISGRKFSELPSAMQHMLETVSISVIYFDNLTSEEERELFKRLNAGKPLSAKARSIASCRDVHGLMEIGAHSLFAEMLTDKARSGKNQIPIVGKCHCMLAENIHNISFESRIFNPKLEAMEISAEDKQTLDAVFDKVVAIHGQMLAMGEKRAAKKLYKETHLVSLVPYIHRAMNEGVDSGLLAQWIAGFYGTKKVASVSDQYNNCCASGSAKNASIVGRDAALAESYDEFFQVDEQEMTASEEAATTEAADAPNTETDAENDDVMNVGDLVIDEMDVEDDTDDQEKPVEDER